MTTQELQILITFLIIVTSTLLLDYVVGTLKTKNVITVVPIGSYTTSRGSEFNLSEYCVDKDNQLYSVNAYTWELDRKKGKDILKCSNMSTDNSGYIVNSLRDTNGNKVTIRRDCISFDLLSKTRPTLKLIVSKTTDRHLKLVKSVY